MNSQAGSAVAAGTIRGAHLALGRKGRVHVAWNGSGTALPKGLPNPGVAHLNAYLASVSPSKDVKPRKIIYKPKVLTDFAGGDVKKGKKNVEVYCSTCHGDSDEHIQFALKAGRINKKKIAMKVRGWQKSSKAKSGMKFNPAKGSMSFFAKNRLPDKDLLDIIAYLGK